MAMQQRPGADAGEPDAGSDLQMAYRKAVTEDAPTALRAVATKRAGGRSADAHATYPPEAA